MRNRDDRPVREVVIEQTRATGVLPCIKLKQEDDIIAYVLSDFTDEEKQAIIQVIPRASEAILCLLTEGLVAAMNRYN